MAIINGSLFDDVLFTTAAADTVTAQAGNDIILIAAAAEHAAGEVINGGTGYDRIWFTSSGAGETLTLLSGVTLVEAVEISDAVGNTTGTTALNINAGAVTTGLSLIGNDGVNTLTGTAKDDVIFGNGGNDTISGGFGNDRVVMRVEAADLDTIDAGLAAEGNTLVLVGAAAGQVDIDLSVAAGADQLTEINAAPEALVQSDFSHVDASELAGGGITATGSAGVNTLIGSAQDDVLDGGAGVDVLVGGGGNDVFLIAASTHFSTSETVDGGVGDDILRFTSATAAQTLTLGAKVTGIETAEISDAAGDTSGAIALNLSAAAVKNGLTLTGNDGANSITGTAFDDDLNGNAGADTLIGGTGNDHYIIDAGADSEAGDKITDASGAADYIVFTSATPGDLITLGAGITGIEAVYLSDLALDITGTANLNVDANLTTVALTFIGNEGDNTLLGGNKNDVFTGNGGTDTISGALGNDTVYMDVGSVDIIDAGSASEGNTLRLKGSAAGEVVMNLAVAANADQLISINTVVDGLQQSDFSHVDASELLDFGVAITGSAGVNRLVGSAQDDVLEGGAGADILAGGGGNDAFVIGPAADFTSAETISGGDGNDILRFASTVAGQTLTLTALVTGVEAAEISDATGDTSGIVALNLKADKAVNALALAGNDGNNIITGTAFNDVLNGNFGADTLIGGMGNDHYVVDSEADSVAGDKITDTAGTADYVIFTSVTAGETLTLGAGVTGIEAVYISDDALDTTGTTNLDVDASALTIGLNYYGNDGDNAITGGKGNDFITGNGGTDTITAGLGNDTVYMDVASPDVADAGSASEGNTLVLTGDTGGFGVFIELGGDLFNPNVPVTANADQVSSFAGVQSDFTRIDASAMTGGGIFVVGSSGADNIIGTAESDVFMPGTGKDVIEGGDGNDAWYIFSLAEYSGDIYTDNGSTLGDYVFFDGADGQTLTFSKDAIGIDVVAAGLNPSTTANININAAAVDNSFSMAGNAGDNKLTGTRNGETIFDWGGKDVMNGGGGPDEYYIVSAAYWVAGDTISDTGSNEISFEGAGGGVLQLTTAVSANVTGIDRVVIGGPDLSGSPYIRDNTTTNTAGVDASGLKNAILLAGNDGDNLLTATKFNDTILGYGGNDTIVAGLGTDTVTMQVDATSIDDIDAGLLAENNVLILTGATVGIVELDLSLADQVTMIDGVAEGLIQSGFAHVDASAVAAFGVSIIGSAGANRLTGTAQDDVLIGGGGADTLDGGAGNDVFVVRALTEYVAGEIVSGGDGDDAMWFASTTAGQTLKLNANTTGIEVMAIADAAGSTAGITALNIDAGSLKSTMKLIGNDGANSLTGGAANDTLTGNGGADSLNGGAGNDLYLYNTGAEFGVGEKITDSAGSADILQFAASAPDTLTLSANVKGLEIVEIDDLDDDVGDLTTGTTALDLDASLVTTALDLRGNDGDNTITGTAKNDTISGYGGNDVINAGAGADVINMVAEDASLDDVNAGAITEGNKLVLTGSAAGAMVWDLASATDQLVSVLGADEGHTVLGVTHLDASALDGAGVTITGSAQVNILVGTSVDDVFITLSSTDFGTGETITGGTGSDILRFASTTAGQTLTLTTKVTGIEAAQISDATGDTTGFTALNLNAAAAANAMTLTGNDGNNTITGTKYADTITGNGGQDTINAGAGADTVYMQVDAGSLDAINAGAITEGNSWVLDGAAAGALVINLASTADQLVSVGGVAEALKQTGFVHLDASAVTTAMTITGTTAANRITGGSAADTIDGGAGNDTLAGGLGLDTITGGLGNDAVTMDVSAGNLDAVNAGAASEGNALTLTGAAAGTVTVDLSSALDQLTDINGAGEALVQSGFASLDAFAMTGGGVDVTGSGAANYIVGTAAADTIDAGGGADTIVMDLPAFDTLDAGGGGEGDTLVLRGAAGDRLVIDLSVAPGADQIVSVGAAPEAAVQADFQHIDVSAMSFGADVRGNDLNNVLTGSALDDRFTGLGGADTINLGTLAGAGDGQADSVIYESPADGWNSAAVAFSFDRISYFESGMDTVEFTAQFNGGGDNLDDITDDDIFTFATDVRADFSTTDEALLISSAVSKLTLAGDLSQAGFAKVLGVINKLGVTSVAGDDGLIVVQTATASGIYYYQESDGKAGNVVASELTLLGVLDAAAAASDFLLS